MEHTLSLVTAHALNYGTIIPHLLSLLFNGPNGLLGIFEDNIVILALLASLLEKQSDSITNILSFLSDKRVETNSENLCRVQVQTGCC